MLRFALKLQHATNKKGNVCIHEEVHQKVLDFELYSELGCDPFREQAALV